MSNGLASGVGLEMLSFLVLPFPFIIEPGSCMALLIPLPLVVLECPPSRKPPSLSFRGGIDMLLMLAFLLCVADPAFEDKAEALPK
jgi:hypothetical protein